MQVGYSFSAKGPFPVPIDDPFIYKLHDCKLRSFIIEISRLLRHSQE